MQTILWNGELLVYVLKRFTKLIPIYDLTKKGVPFCWGEDLQKTFDQIKHDLTNAPVLAMPNTEGHMVLVSDTSKIVCGSALYQNRKVDIV